MKTYIFPLALLLGIASSFADMAEALTFTYGGSRGASLISSDNSTVIQSWSSISNPYAAHLTDSGSVWFTSGSGGGGGMGGTGCAANGAP